MPAIDMNIEKWSISRKLAVVMPIVIIIGVFLPWYSMSYEVTTHGYTQRTLIIEKGTEYTEAMSIIFASLFALFFLVLGYEVALNMPSNRLRINEILAIMFGFLVFVNTLIIANEISEDMAQKRAQIQGLATISGGVGYGLYICIIGAFLLMLFSFLSWKEKTMPEEESREDAVED